MASFNQTAGFMSKPLISGQSSSRQSSSSASGVTHPYQTMMSAGGANPASLSGFQDYSGYLNAYNRGAGGAYGPQSVLGGAGNPYAKSASARGNTVGVGMPGYASSYVDRTPYSKEEFLKSQESSRIGSGQRLREAYGRAEDSLQTDVGTMPDELYNRYKSLLNDPSQVSNLPGYQFALQQGEESRRRATSRERSAPRRELALQEFGQGMAAQRYGEFLGQAQTGATTEANRFGANADVALNKNRLRSSLMTEPDKAIFNQYWGADPWSSSSSSATRDQTQYAVPKKA